MPNTPQSWNSISTTPTHTTIQIESEVPPSPVRQPSPACQAARSVALDMLPRGQLSADQPDHQHEGGPLERFRANSWNNWKVVRSSAARDMASAGPAAVLGSLVETGLNAAQNAKQYADLIQVVTGIAAAIQVGTGATYGGALGKFAGDQLHKSMSVLTAWARQADPRDYGHLAALVSTLKKAEPYLETAAPHFQTAALMAGLLAGASVGATSVVMAGQVKTAADVVQAISRAFFQQAIWSRHGSNFQWKDGPQAAYLLVPALAYGGTSVAASYISNAVNAPHWALSAALAGGLACLTEGEDAALGAIFRSAAEGTTFEERRLVDNRMVIPSTMKEALSRSGNKLVVELAKGLGEKTGTPVGKMVLLGVGSALTEFRTFVLRAVSDYADGILVGLLPQRAPVDLNTMALVRMEEGGPTGSDAPNRPTSSPGEASASQSGSHALSSRRREAGRNEAAESGTHIAPVSEETAGSVNARGVSSATCHGPGKGEINRKAAEVAAILRGVSQAVHCSPSDGLPLRTQQLRKDIRQLRSGTDALIQNEKVILERASTLTQALNEKVDRARHKVLNSREAQRKAEEEYSAILKFLEPYDAQIAKQQERRRMDNREAEARFRARLHENDIAREEGQARIRARFEAESRALDAAAFMQEAERARLRVEQVKAHVQNTSATHAQAERNLNTAQERAREAEEVVRAQSEAVDVAGYAGQKAAALALSLEENQHEPDKETKRRAFDNMEKEFQQLLAKYERQVAEGRQRREKLEALVAEKTRIRVEAEARATGNVKHTHSL